MSQTFGPTYQVSIDGARLLKQHEVIRDLMLDGVWRTLAEIEGLTGYPQASISAQLRHLRKDSFGGFMVYKRRRMPWSGLYEYQVGGNSDPKPPAASVLQRRDAAPASSFTKQPEMFTGWHSNQFRTSCGI